MLQAPGQLAGADHLDGVAAVGVSPRHDVLPPHGVEVEPRHRQAALGPVLLLRVGKLQHRVDQVPVHAVDVEDERPEPDPDLVGREPRALLLAQRVEQVPHEAAAVRRTRSRRRPRW